MAGLVRTWKEFVVSGFKFDKRGMRKLFEEIAAKSEAADRKFRQAHAGLPYGVVRADAVHAFPDGEELAEEDLNKYAAAVAADEPFEFRLRQ